MQPSDTICGLIRKAEANYTFGTVQISKHVDWSMHETIERINAYINSKHISGAQDSLGRDKPFFNIVLAVRNITWRATDIDRKDIRFVPSKSTSVALAFVANVLLQRWMDENRFGQFLNKWGLQLATYGSAISKWKDMGDRLYPCVVPWNRAIVDPIDFEALPRIEKFYKTPAQLRAMATVGDPNYAHYDKDVVEKIIDARQTRKNLDGSQKDNMSEFCELYEVHGKLPRALLEKDPQSAKESLWKDYSQQMHVVTYLGTENGEYADFCLYKGRESKDIYQKDDLIEEDNRTLAIGPVEASFDAQWMVNHAQKNIKDTLDLASKLIFQTSDAHFVGRNVLSAIENGDILIHKKEAPLTQINNSKADITAFQNFSEQWKALVSELTSTPDAIRGNTLPSGTPYSLGAYLGQQANSLFELMTENKGLAIEDMMKKHVIPHLKKQLKNKKEIVGILDDAGIKEIDSMYIPQEAVRRFNKRTADAMFSRQPVQPFNVQAEAQAVQQSMAHLGNKRFFSPDELSEKQWDQIFSDFEWDSIRVEVTNESVDKAAVLQTLSTVLQTVAANPAILQDPNAKMLFGQILSETGRISPIQLSSSSSVGGGAGDLAALTNKNGQTSKTDGAGNPAGAYSV